MLPGNCLLGPKHGVEQLGPDPPLKALILESLLPTIIHCSVRCKITTHDFPQDPVLSDMQTWGREGLI